MSATAQLLDTGQTSKIAIIDCDYHYGDGAQAIIDAMGLEDRVLHTSLGLNYKRPEHVGPYLARMRGLRSTRFRASSRCTSPRSKKRSGSGAGSRFTTWNGGG